MGFATCIDVNETSDRPAEGDRHFPSERTHGAPALRGSVNTPRQRPKLYPERLKGIYFLWLGREPRVVEVVEHEVQGEESPQDFRPRSVLAVPDVLGTDSAVDSSGIEPADGADSLQIEFGRETALDKRVDEPTRRSPGADAAEASVLRPQEDAAVQRDEGDPLRCPGLEPEFLDGLLAALQVRDHSSSRPSLPPRPEPPPPPPPPSRPASPSLRLARPSAACMRKPAASFREISLPR